MLEKTTQGPFWWPTATRDIRSYIKQCPTCKQENGTTPTQQKSD